MHLRRRPEREDAERRSIWPPSAGIGLRAKRPAGPLDAVGWEPPALGVLALSDERLNRRAERLGVTERSLGWLRVWGEQFPDLAFELVEFIVERGAQTSLPAETVVLAGVDRLLSGRIDDDWLAAEQRSADAAFDEVVTVLRLLGLCELAAAYGASAAEVGALASAVACHDAFRRSVHADALPDRSPAEAPAMATGAGGGADTFALVADEVRVLARPGRTAGPHSHR